MTREIFSAQLCIMDGAWQEAPDNLAIIDPGFGRGALYLVAEVLGETEGRDELARAMIETARRAYAASRGAITLALTEAVRAANDFFFNHNAALAPDARRIAGLTAAIVRDDDLFIAQAGPGLTSILRGAQIARYPRDSIWFDPNNDLTEFPTPGAVPIGKRRAYTPDTFHVSLQPGDSILIATRALKTLLTDDELIDTLANRHPDDVIAALEEISGASDLAVIAIRCGENDLNAPPAPPLDAAHVDELEIPALPRAETISPVEIAPPGEISPAPTPEPESPRVNVRATALSVAAHSGQTLARIFARVNWSALAATSGRAIDSLGRASARVIAFVIRTFLPGEIKTDAAKLTTSTTPNAQSGWRIAALGFPIVLILIGTGAFVLDLRDKQTRLAAQTSQLIQQSTVALDQSKNFGGADKKNAVDAAQKALTLADQARKLSPTNQTARNAFYAAQDQIDALNGIAVVFLTAFANFTEAKSNATRVVVHWPEIFILDRGAQKVYRYLVDEVGSKAAPYGTENGVILKAGDKFSDRVVADLIDAFWNDTGRLVVLERSGLFLTYDLQANKWSPRAATDAAKWKSASLASGYAGNLYLLDSAANQILKYAAADGVWTASTNYFQFGVSADLSNAVDLAIDGDIWVLRANGAIQRFTSGRPVEFSARDPEAQLNKPSAFFTAASLNSLYVADAGNKRIVQLDKANGKFARQFRPSGQAGDAFNNLKALAVDEANKRFFILSGSSAYLATIPQ